MEIQYHEARIKKSQTIFLKPDIVHAPVMANVISALYTIIPPVSIYCSALSAFSPRCPMAGTLRATTLHCYRRRWSAANLAVPSHPCMRSLRLREALCRLPRQLFDPLELEFSGALTRKHVWKHVACVSIPLLHTSQGRVWRTYTRASVHIAERWTVPSRRSLESV